MQGTHLGIGTKRLLHAYTYFLFTLKRKHPYLLYFKFTPRHHQPMLVCSVLYFAMY